jgi:uncharacterized protein YbjT (DUF2867 family)
MKRTAIVFGATGLVGKELIAQLLLNPEYEKVTAVVRRPLDITNAHFNEVILHDFSKLESEKHKLRSTEYFCCIGTTIKTAGSQNAFKKVDFDIPLQIAKLAQELAVSSLVVVSSVGANSNTGNFYLRTKGEMENAVRAAYGGNLKIVRPSLLMGNREEYRFAEKLSVVFMNMFGWLFMGPMKKYRGIYASAVARAMIKSTNITADKVFLESDELQEMA